MQKTTSSKTSNSKVQNPYLEKMHELAFNVQKEVCNETSRIDGTPFKFSDEYGETKDRRFQSWFKLGLLENSRLFEKASFVVAESMGKFTKESELSARDEAAEKEMHFRSSGFSMVFHSKNPMIPSTRIHYHLIVREDGYFWYSGGGDLTPYHLFEEDAKNFHRLHKEPADKFLGEGWYQKMKEASDEYFFIKHRGHIRGVGGTFFDNFNENAFGKERKKTGQTIDSLFTFCKESCKIINPAYNAIVDKRQHEKFSDSDVEFMKLLRGRYSEFDLIYDRGIKFGIDVGMPIEIPLLAIPDSKWAYKWEEKYKAGSPQRKLLDVLYHPRKWV